MRLLALTIHRNLDAVVLEHARPGDARELTALIGVEDFRPAVSGDRLFQRLDTERCDEALGERSPSFECGRWSL